ncbi:MAG: ATP-binding protein, partial [Halobacteriales archaeon]
GTEFWNRVKIAPVENDDGEVTNFVGFQEDITERKERTQELRQYERIINTIQEAACIYDEDARFVAVNEYLAEFYNTTPEALVGQSSNLIPQIRARKDGDPFQELLDGDREEVHGEFEGEFPGVGYEVLAYQLTPLEIDGDIQGVVGVAYEVTERKERERELKQRNRQLDEFTSVVSHDLQTPLSVAEGRLELAQEECDSDHLDDALSAIKRSQELIDELLTLAREGTELGEIESVALSEVVEQSWQTVDTANATLVTDTDRTVRADRSRLQQLLENLIRNAIKYGGEDVTVTVGTLADGFYIEDDGPGIPADERERVLDAGYSTDDDSTGFGLAIVNQISEAHGWTISVGESEHGGARFAITDVTVVE